MPRIMCFDFLCLKCNEKTEHYVDTQQEGWDRGAKCDACGSTNTKKVISAPEIRTDDNAATFLDGTKRRGAEDLKKAAKLEVEKARARPGSPERAAIQREINERKKLR